MVVALRTTTTTTTTMKKCAQLVVYGSVVCMRDREGATQGEREPGITPAACLYACKMHLLLLCSVHRANAYVSYRIIIIIPRNNNNKKKLYQAAAACHCQCRERPNAFFFFLRKTKDEKVQQ